jgi:hypothetical protein
VPQQPDRIRLGWNTSIIKQEDTMARPVPSDQDRIIETWESVVAGTVYVWVYDRREDKYIKQAVGGRSASKRLHISRDDRKYNQELVPPENRQHDPFTNGALRLKESANRDESLDIRYHYTDEDLKTFFEIRDEALFSEAIEAVESELILRRLEAVAEKEGTVAQHEALREVVRERYPIGGTQRTVAEMYRENERSFAERL